jgi:hypothetical protein
MAIFCFITGYNSSDNKNNEAPDDVAGGHLKILSILCTCYFQIASKTGAKREFNYHSTQKAPKRGLSRLWLFLDKN